jgi:hypothetical protein
VDANRIREFIELFVFKSAPGLLFPGLNMIERNRLNRLDGLGQRSGRRRGGSLLSYDAGRLRSAISCRQ